MKFLDFISGTDADNPPQLWLGPMGDELHVQLLAVEPHPY